MDAIGIAATVMSSLKQGEHVRRKYTVLETSAHEVSPKSIDLIARVGAINGALHTLPELLLHNTGTIKSETFTELIQLLEDYQKFLKRLESDFPLPRQLIVLKGAKASSRMLRLDTKAKNLENQFVVLLDSMKMVYVMDQETHALQVNVISVQHDNCEQSEAQEIDPDPHATRRTLYMKKLEQRQKRFFERTSFVAKKHIYLHLSVATHECDPPLKDMAHEIHDDGTASSRPWLLAGNFRDHSLPIRNEHNDEDINTLGSFRHEHELRLVVCGTDPPSMGQDNISLASDTYISMMDTLQLPAELLVVMHTGTPVLMRTLQRSHPDRQPEYVKYVMRMPLSSSNNWSLAVSWDGITSQTSAFAHGFQKKELESLLSSLQDFKGKYIHPLLLPVLLCELVTDTDSNQIKMHASNLYQVEVRTNYLKIGKLGKAQVGPTSDGEEDFTAHDEFEDLTRKLNAIASRLAFHEMRLCSNVTLVETTEKYIAEHEDFLSKQNLSHWQIMSNVLLQRLHNIQVEHAALLLEISCNQKIAQGQLQIVYNLIAQRDNRDSLGIAAISKDIAALTKDDSFAMRTIAFMTIAFLPATAISSIFSMSMFDWQAAEAASVVSTRIWIYWAVSIPLTLVVLGIWLLWIHEHKKREARAELGSRSRHPTAMDDRNAVPLLDRAWRMLRGRVTRNHTSHEESIDNVELDHTSIRGRLSSTSSFHPPARAGTTFVRGPKR